MSGQNQIAEKLNEHFVSVGPKLASKLEVKPDDDPTTYLHSIDANQKFSFKMMSEETMLTSLNMLKNGKAPGPDGVPTNLVKDAAKFIAKPLAMIFNASLAQGIFPNIWKLAKITPLFKFGARNKKNNYRPISGSRPHSGASSQDMADFIKPYLRKKPDAIILHCGTNDLTKGVNTIESLEQIVQAAKTESKGTELVISGLVTRRDKPGMIKKVADLNSRIKDFCRNQQIKFIDNNNLDAACLAAKKLHLNKRGNSYLANNFLKVISEL